MTLSREIDYKELAHAVIETGQSQNCSQRAGDPGEPVSVQVQRQGSKLMS